MPAYNADARRPCDSGACDCEMPEQDKFHIELRDVSKSYRRGVVSVDAVNLQIASGELVSLLGPSGCGKSTILMMLAGFESPSHGDILIDGHSVLSIPPYQREIGMVFQDYALFPHLTVAENVAYPLRMRNVPAGEVRERTRAMLDIVKLSGAENRRPFTLHAGQQQRVALARALVFEPRVVLLDEPLGTLDRHLRDELRAELRDIHARLGNTIVFATHDQAEAMSLSDRVAVLESGRIVQTGTPSELYERPASSLVARFIGECNMLRGTVRTIEEDTCEVVLDTGETVYALPVNVSGAGARTQVAVRPERIDLDPPQESGHENRFPCRIRELIFMGDHVHCRMDLGGNSKFSIRLPASALDEGITTGTEIEVCWRRAHCRALDAETDARR